MLTTNPFNDQLDLAPWVGQRSATFSFRHLNGVTGQNLGQLTPIRPAQLSHDTSRTIKRQLNLTLGVADTAAINTISSRVEVSMEVAGSSYPLGRYMFTNFSKVISTGGDQSAAILTDEMFLVDQPITHSVGGLGASVMTVIKKVLENLPISFTLDASPFTSSQGWTIGTTVGQILEALALTGDYFSPWFGNDQKLHFIRSFDPADEVAQFDFDAGNQVLRAPIEETNDLITAPNRFTVVNSGSASPNAEISASVDVPSSAPHSIFNRGFVVASIQNLPVSSVPQASLVAKNLARRQTIFERVTLATPPDPRHDSYDVIIWQGQKWLELSWTLPLIEGGVMTHLLRKAYS